MTFSKPFTLVAGVAALVVITYFGFGAANQTNTAKAATELKLDSGKAKLGYTVGVQIGGDLMRSGMVDNIDVEAFLAAQRDILTGSEPRMTIEGMQQAQEAFQLRQQQEFAALSSENKTKGEAFLAENKTADGIKTTNSGLQYQIIREGKGKSPTAEDTVTVHYLGALIDGTPFDSSYERNQPADFPVSGVIPGFSEGIQLMKEGAKYRFVIPSDLAYGERAPASIGPNQALVFEVELIAIK